MTRVPATSITDKEIEQVTEKINQMSNLGPKEHAVVLSVFAAALKEIEAKGIVSALTPATDRTDSEELLSQRFRRLFQTIAGVSLGVESSGEDGAPEIIAFRDGIQLSRRYLKSNNESKEEK